MPLDQYRTVTFALLVWLAASALAWWASSISIVLALIVAVAGGLVFGWLSARRVDSRKVRVRRTKLY
jgi:hypothetical protein